MIVRRSCGLYPFENLLIFFRDAFQFSLPTLLVLGFGIFDAIICTVDIAFALFGRIEAVDIERNGIGQSRYDRLFRVKLSNSCKQT